MKFVRFTQGLLVTFGSLCTVCSAISFSIHFPIDATGYCKNAAIPALFEVYY